MHQINSSNQSRIFASRRPSRRRLGLAVATGLTGYVLMPWTSAAYAESPLVPSPPDVEAVVIDDAQLPTAKRPVYRTEVRHIDAELLEASWPMKHSAGYAAGTCPTCGGSGYCGAGDTVCDDAVGGTLIGPSDEYLCDGGDFGLQAAVRADWTVDGLEQEDAIAHYDTVDGRVLVTPSNRVCVYAPRFAAVRRVVSLQEHERRQLIDIAVEEDSLASAAELQPVATSTQRHAVAINRRENPALLFRGREQAGGLENQQAVMELYNSLAAYANIEIIRTGQVDGVDEVKLERGVQAAVTWTSDVGAQVVLENKQAVAMVGLKQPGIVYQTDGPENPWLRLIKLASTHHALPGEEVEFTLRFDNIGDQVIGNVTIVDNLATRLEYVPDSARSSLDADFSATPNGAGSTVLRWEIRDPLEAGNGGILQFTCRVR